MRKGLRERVHGEGESEGKKKKKKGGSERTVAVKHTNIYRE